MTATPDNYPPDGPPPDGGPRGGGPPDGPEEDGGAPRLPRRIRLLYASGSAASNALSQAFGLWLIYFYVPPDDADISARVPDIGPIDARVAFGLVLTAARLVEAFDDPLIGYWSDRTRSRWGRRIPFVLLGTPWWVLSFVLLFTPPAAGSAGANLIYLFLVAEIHFLLSNLAGAPMEALLPHIARRNEDRVSVATWQVVFGVTGAAIGLSLSSLLQALFGFQVMAIVIAAIALGARYLALFGTWRYARTDDRPSTPGFRVAVRQTLSNRPFLAFLPSFVLFQVGLQMLTALLPFYVDAVLVGSSFLGFTGAEDEGIFTFLLTAVVIAGMLAAVPWFARRARRLGKANAYRVAMIGATVAFSSLFLAGFIPGIPKLPQAVIGIFLAGLPTAGVFLFPNIITADIVDYDQSRTATRREAMFYGTQNLLEKLATAVSPLLFALVLLAGDSEANPLGIRLVGPVAGALVLLGYLAFRRYTLDDPPPSEARTPTPPPPS